MSPSPHRDDLEALLSVATFALEAGDPEVAARAVAGALAHLGGGPGPVDLERLAAVHARLTALAERETARLSRELSLLGNSRRAAGAYHGG